MRDEQKRVALIDLNGEFLGYAVGGKLINKKDDVDAKPVVWMDAEGVIVGNNEGGTARPLYLHPAPDVVAQLVEALQSTEMFLDYVYNQDIDSLSFNKLMTQIIVVEQALAAAKEAGYE